MKSDLAKALDESGRIVNEALARAREELTALNTRRAELEALIAQAEAVTRTRDGAATPSRSLTLHDAIALVLNEENNRWMSVRELADAINGRGLYCKRDGSKVEQNQIHARTRNYEQIFEKNGPNIRLRASQEGEHR
jgi:hypothetical protein